MPMADWFLAPDERGNPATLLDRRHPEGTAWSAGNEVRPLIHGAAYFAALAHAVDRMVRGDLLLFVDWRGDPDERLTGQPGSAVSQLLRRAAERGVDVRGLVWRSHLDRLRFSEAENRHLGEEINAAGGQCLLDMRVRAGGSHHQKFVVLRHPGRPESDVAFVGGIDLCHGRRDDAAHRGDPQRQPMAAVYGPRPPWHDVQLAVRGPAVGDVELVFRERWDDPQPLSRNPVHRVADLLRGDDRARRPLPPQLPDPPAVGSHTVQLLRTYPCRVSGYPFAPRGERSVARGYLKAFGRAERLIYLEDQYLWSFEAAAALAAALRGRPQLRLIAVLPHYPDQDGRISGPPNLVGRQHALALLREAGGDRVAVYGPENPAGTPVYVHAKVCIVDDVWAAVGSDNLNRRSWTHDSELTAAVWDETPAAPGPETGGLETGGAGRSGVEQPRRYAQQLRLALAREHLGRADGDDADPADPADLADPLGVFAEFARSAAELQRWHDGGRAGARPPGRLRPLAEPTLSPMTRRWATPLYHRIYDPDGRPRGLRRRHGF
jgi:phosphatidylserine/phosphatidylglycerophosphate/cardiolipin synthase-like enzyme